MKKILLSCVCALALSACAAGQPGNKQPGPTAIVKPKTAVDIANEIAAIQPAQIPMDPGVQMYNTSGPFSNPLKGDHTHSILDNTTAGGYTVFDESVTVYPLPGENLPGFMPTYAVPPYKGGIAEPAPRMPGMVGQPMGLASAGILPPVRNVDVAAADPYARPPVAGQVRKPLTLTAPEPLSMQPPVSATPAPRSPFAGSLTAAEPVAAAPAPEPVMAAAPGMQAGRRSPSLTGY